MITAITPQMRNSTVPNLCVTTAMALKVYQLATAPFKRTDHVQTANGNPILMLSMIMKKPWACKFGIF